MESLPKTGSGTNYKKFVRTYCGLTGVTGEMDLCAVRVETMSSKWGPLWRLLRASARTRVSPGACSRVMVSCCTAATSHSSLEHAARM